MTDGAALDEAIRQARLGLREGGAPYGAVVLRGSAVLAAAPNRVAAGGDPTAHAEVEAIRRAAAALGSPDLADCTLYTTAEPCLMCCGAIFWAGIRRVVYGARDPRFGAAAHLAATTSIELHDAASPACADLLAEAMRRLDAD